MTSQAICKPIDKGVTPNNSKSCTYEDPSTVRPHHNDALIVQQSASPKYKGWSTISLTTRLNQVRSFTIVFFALLLLLLLLLLQGACCCCCLSCCCCCFAFCGRCSTRCNVLSVHCLSVCLSVFSPISPISPLRLDIGSLQPCHHREPVRQLFWLLARLDAALWRCACWIRSQSGSTMPFSTTSCVGSTHHCLRKSDFCSLLLSAPQRILLAVYFLPLHFLVLAPPGPQLHSLALFAPPEHSLLSHSS